MGRAAPWLAEAPGPLDSRASPSLHGQDPSPRPAPAPVTCFHPLWDCVGGMGSSELLHPGWLHTQIFPEAFAKPTCSSCHQAGEHGTDRGTGCGRRLEKGCVVAMEGQAVTEAGPLEVGASAGLQGFWECCLEQRSGEVRTGTAGRSKGLSRGGNVGMRGRMEERAWSKGSAGRGQSEQI